MPAEGPERAGEAPADGAGGVDADKVKVAGFALEQGQHIAQFGQRLLLLAVAVPGAFVQAQVRIDRQQWQGLAQLLQGREQALAIQLRVTTQGHLLLCLAAIADQPQLRAGLVHGAGLAHLGMVETHELRLFGAVAEGELFARLQGFAHIPDQGFESVFHQASPPNTSIWRNTQAGEAWPTRTTWLGSPLPQLGVPSTWKVLLSPTAARLRQNCAEMPR
ncbi:hypothetical protein D3C79_632680 [compost metagenome]